MQGVPKGGEGRVEGDVIIIVYMIIHMPANFRILKLTNIILALI